MCLEELDKTNRRFMRMGAKRFSELVEKFWSD
jgi:hypothetical protein